MNKSISNKQYIENLIAMAKGGSSIARFEIMHGFEPDSAEGVNLIAGLDAIDKALGDLPRAIEDYVNRFAEKGVYNNDD